MLNFVWQYEQSKTKRMSDKQKDNLGEPRLSRGMRHFIIVGTIILLVALLAQFTVGDGLGNNTSFDPDSTLLERKAVPLPAVDTARSDAAEADSTLRKPKKEAAKTETDEGRSVEAEQSEAPAEEVTLEKMGQEEGKTAQPKPSPSVPKTPKPHIEVLEN